MEQSEMMDDDFKQLDWYYDNYPSVVNVNPEDFGTVTGNESYFCLTYGYMAHGGMEAGIGESIKKAANSVYESVMVMLKKIKNFFFGESEEAVKKSQDKAEETIEALVEMDGAAPIPDDSAARDPEVYVKPLEGGADFEEVLKENSNLESSIKSIKTAVDGISNCNTIAKLRTQYAAITKAINAGIKGASESMKESLREAETASGKLKTPKIPDEGDPQEVKDGIKQENTQNADNAKEATKKARIIGGVRNKLVSALNAISAQAGKLKAEPPKSNFKG